MNYPDWYASISKPFRGATAAHLIDMLDRGLVIVISVAYIGSLAWLALTGDMRFWKALIVPAITFGLITVIRTVLDMPRPYKLYDIDPILVKGCKGRSFPSRHVSSAVVIACTLLWLSPIPGTIALLGSAVVAATRIIGGVHFPRDVIAAIALSLICAAVGFIVIP